MELEGKKMPRAKKDGHYINYYISRDLYEMLQEYAERKGQTGTMAIERILRKFFEEESQIRVEKMEMK